MIKKKSYDELYNDLRRYQRYVGYTVKHKASDTFYIIKGFQFKEADMSIEFTYGPVESKFPIWFSRPIAELFDGRYEGITK